MGEGGREEEKGEEEGKESESNRRWPSHHTRQQCGGQSQHREYVEKDVSPTNHGDVTHAPIQTIVKPHAEHLKFLAASLVG